MENDLQLSMQHKHHDKRAYSLSKDGKFVAYLEIDEYPDFVALEDVVTFGDHRRKGYMRQMIDEVRKREEATTVRLLVYPDNKPAIKLYRSLGFRFTKDGVYRDALGARCANPEDVKILAKLPEMVWVATEA
jgi:ribosomal protein S18 acetylase RimI-like enzyme